MPRTTSRKKTSTPQVSVPKWPKATELVGIRFALQPIAADPLKTNYATGLHAWFLQQIQAINPALSAYLHDGESEKAFTLSRLDGQLDTEGRQFRLRPEQTYHWTITALSQDTVQGLADWLKVLPERVELYDAPLTIQQVDIAHPAATYTEFIAREVPLSPTVTLSFLSPTSFRRKGHHLPLPWPRNIFHSYLRRWNDFSGQSIEQDAFLDWIDEHVIIQRHQLQSQKVAAGKRGSVTGFVGAIQFSLANKAKSDRGYVDLFYRLGQLAPYFGTGHKTTFGLGQTQLGWIDEADTPTQNPVETLLAQRIAELTDILMSQRKRTGGTRAETVAEKQATVLARRELGESLPTIAADMDLPYETVKTYSKLARRALREGGTGRRMK